MRIPTLFLLVALLLSACGGAKEVKGADGLLENIKQDLRNGRLVKIRILFLDYHIATFVAVTPESLEGYAEVTGGINKLFDVDATIKSSLLEALAKTTLSAVENPPDVRWGAIFYDAGGVALHSIYIDKKYIGRTGNDAVIDGKLIRINGAVREWFERTFHQLMEAVRERTP